MYSLFLYLCFWNEEVCYEVTFHNQLFAFGLLKPRWSFRLEVFVVCRTSIQKKETQTTSIALNL